MGKEKKAFLLSSQFCPQGVVCLCPGAIYMYKSIKIYTRTRCQESVYSTIVGKDLIFTYPAWIFQFFHATKPQNSHGFCVELAGFTREFSRELQEIFARNSRIVTCDAWSLLHIPDDRSFQHRSQKSREECEDNCFTVYHETFVTLINHFILFWLFQFYFHFHLLMTGI